MHYKNLLYESLLTPTTPRPEQDKLSKKNIIAGPHTMQVWVLWSNGRVQDRL